MNQFIKETSMYMQNVDEYVWFHVKENYLTIFEDIHKNADLLIKIPFNKTAITISVDNKINNFDFSLFLEKIEDNKIGVKTTFSARESNDFLFFYIKRKEDGKIACKQNRVGEWSIETTDKDMFNVIVLIIRALKRINETKPDGYRPIIKRDALNKKRAAKGKPLLIYDWHTVKLPNQSEKQEPQGGTHASPRAHQRRGHWRNLKSGKRVFVRDCWVGDRSLGAVFKDYQVIQSATIH